MRYCILGPLEVSDGARTVALAQGRQRLLLAVLLMHANEAISSERLIDALWGEAPPPTAPRSLHNLVSGLRKALGDGALVTQGHGYLLRVGEGELDAARFDALVEQGRGELAQGQAERAGALLREALELWRGPPLADVAYEPAVLGEAARLEESRQAALEERIDADLARGRHAELTAELEALVARHPLRERLRGQQMLALYRAGRQADALRVYSDARRHLLDELGIEPGPALRELERAVLEHDPSLGSPDPLPPAPPSKAPVVIPRRIRARLGAVLAAGGLLVAAAIGAVLLTGGSDSGKGALGAIAGDSLAGIDPDGDRIVAAVPVGGTPTSVTVGADAVWVLNADDQTIARVGPRSGRVRTVGVGATPTAVAAGHDELWVGTSAGFGADRLVRLEPDELAVKDTVELPRAGHQGTTGLLQSLAIGPDAVWAINGGEDLARVDRRTHKVSQVRRLRARAVAVDGDSVWALAADEATLVRIDARSAAVLKRIKLPAARLDAISAGAGVVWATDAYDGTLWRIEPGPRYITETISVGAGADGVAVGAGSVWVINSLRGTLARVDPRRRRVVRTVAVGNTPRGLAIGAGRVWVSLAGGAGTVPAARDAGATRALPRSACGHVLSAPGQAPDYLIASDLPLKLPPEYGIQSIANAVAFVLRQHHFRAGGYRIGYQSCDDATANSTGGDPRKCEANAKEYAAEPTLLGIVGPFNSGCTQLAIPILNAAKPAPVAMVSPSNSLVGLTHRALLAPRDAMAHMYPTGVRNYVRVFPPDDAEAAADAVLAQRLGVQRAYVLDDQSDVGRELAVYFRRSARAIGLRVVGFAHWEPAGSGFAALAGRVRRARADGVFVSGLSGSNGGPLVRALRRRLGTRVMLIAPNPFGPPDFVFDSSGGTAKNMYYSNPGVAPLSRSGERFARDFEATQPGVAVRSEAEYAAGATEVLLDAIARSDGTRASVVQALLATRLRGGILGPLRFDRNGDPIAPPVTIMRIGGTSDVRDAEHAGIDRVITPPPEAFISR